MRQTKPAEPRSPRSLARKKPEDPPACLSARQRSWSENVLCFWTAAFRTKAPRRRRNGLPPTVRVAFLYTFADSRSTPCGDWIERSDAGIRPIKVFRGLFVSPQAHPQSDVYHRNVAFTAHFWRFRASPTACSITLAGAQANPVSWIEFIGTEGEDAAFS